MAVNNGECRGERVTLVEIVLDSCGLEFSKGACTATGEPCFNSWNTCKAPCSFECKTRSYWFSSCIIPSHLAASYTNNVVSVESNPTTLEIGKSISTRGRIKITFQDGPHNDQGFDPYWPRGAIPIICATDMPGTLFGRWIERVKYFENRKANVYHGYCDQSLCEFTKESYYIDSISGPDNSCRVTLTLKDPLILAEDKAAQCPRADDKIVATRVIGREFGLPMKLGVALDGANTDSESEAEPFKQVGRYLLKNNYFAGDAAQDKCFTRLRHICVGNEVLEVRAEINTATPSGWNIVLIDRAACGSTLGPHAIDESINMAETFENEHVADASLRMLTECSDIQDIAISCCDGEENPIINFDSFKELRCKSPLSFISKAIVCKPTGLTTLLNELSEQFMFFIYFNPETGKIETKEFAPPDCNIDLPIIEECEIITFRKKTSEERHSQVTYLHDTIDCTKGISDSNFGSATVTVSADSLSTPCSRREYKTRNNREIKSRWINQENTYIARANGERWLNIRSCPAHQVTIDVSFETAKCVEFGGYAKIHHPKLQDIYGNYIETAWLLKGKSNNGGCQSLVFERTNFDESISPCLTCEGECPSNAKLVDPCEPVKCVGVW